jgi:hypothetical protein
MWSIVAMFSQELQKWSEAKFGRAIMAHATIDLTDPARLRALSLPMPEDLPHDRRFETCTEQCFKDVAASSRKQGLT